MINWNTKIIGNPAKPWIIFLHGFLGSLDDWTELGEKGSLDYQFLLLDLPGHGKTTANRRSDYTMPGTAGQFIEFIKNLGIRKCCLAGYSMGARLALYLVINYPEFFEAVILESVNPGLTRDAERNQRIRQDEKLAREIEDLPVDDFLQKWYQIPLFYTVRTHPRFNDLVDRRINNANRHWYLSLRGMGLGRQPSFWNNLPGIKIPVLILAGEKDEKYSKIAFRMRKKNAGFKISIVKNCGHNIHFENLSHYFAEIKKFLQHRGE